MPTVHSTALVDENARLGEGTVVGPYSIIGPDVTLGKNTIVHSHVVIEGNTILGDDNQVFQFASIGSAPQDLKYQGEKTRLEIGNSNIIREYVTIQPGTIGGGEVTRVGNKNLFMAGSHVGHDAKVGSGCIFANTSALAGHVVVGDYVTIGGMVGVHQFARLGDLCILGGGTMVTKDIPPFCIAQGDRAGLVGINKIGLERKGFSADDIRRLKGIYRDLFHKSEAPFVERATVARELANNFELGVRFLDFLLESRRGITFPRLRTANN
jgi:UDP-N-acetylglucosamine acyltransferase